MYCISSKYIQQIIVNMPRAYSQDLRSRAIWLSEILVFEIDEVSFLLQISTKTTSRYVQKFRMLGHVDTAVMGRPFTCVAMHPYEEIVIMDALLQAFNTQRKRCLKFCTRFTKKQAQNMLVQQFFTIFTFESPHLSLEEINPRP